MSLARPVLTLSAVAVATVSAYYFGERSKTNLQGIHPDLAKVAQCALSRTPFDFTVIDGMRTEEEQRANMAKGVSWTLRSRHLTGKAIDFAAMNGSKITFEPRFYPPIADAFASCSLDLRVPIVWGGSWKTRDWGHIELDRRTYP